MIQRRSESTSIIKNKHKNIKKINPKYKLKLNNITRLETHKHPVSQKSAFKHTRILETRDTKNKIQLPYDFYLDEIIKKI